MEQAFDLLIPNNTFVAMDYHLEWLYAALEVSKSDADETLVRRDCAQLIRGNQEDVDLLIAFESSGHTSLLMLEAKVATGFTNKQTGSKADRLGDIFGSRGDNYPGVVPYFALWSPLSKRPTTRLDCRKWPDWMTREGRPIWIELPVPQALVKVTRCDADGNKNRAGGRWKIDPA